ncbi:DUF192 domain-containing protein [Candidatus Uhrbacteria bacterium]|nr:DUF192 domain-containing protein [Candidatus Uhrbacteria bacterium]
MIRAAFIAGGVLIAAAIVLVTVAALKKPGVKTLTVTVAGHPFTAEVADTVVSHAKGLSGRDALAEGHAMLFVFPYKKQQTFWMKGMLFSLDIIWVDGGRVVGIEENVPLDTNPVPKLYTSPGPVGMVLEVNGGVAAGLGITVGDAVLVSE